MKGTTSIIKINRFSKILELKKSMGTRDVKKGTNYPWDLDLDIYKYS